MPQTISGHRKVTLTSTAPANCLNPLRNPRHMTSVSSLALMLGAAGLVGTTLPATAADVTWNGAISTNWFDPGNWTPGAVPDATNFVNINTLTPNPTVISGAGANGLVVFVGRNAGDVGSLKIINGGTLSDSQGSVGRFAGSIGTVTVDGVGSAWLHADDFYVGAQGTGTVSILNGGLISNVRGILGDGDDAFAVMSVDGAGSTWTNSSTLAVGQNGPGILNITNGGTVGDTDGSIGKGTTSNGTVSIDGAGSTWANSGSLTVGDNGTGNLAITNGGAVSNDKAYVGNQAGSTGLVFVNGAGSTWTNASDLYVANFGTGNLAITNGGAVSNYSGVAGTKAGSNGKVFVDGAGSTWTNNGNLVIGQNGAGALAITNGGVVSTSAGFVGYAAGSTGSITVDGAGSALTDSWSLSIGSFGTGTLTISNGGMVSNVEGIVGDGSGVGTATVDGAGSAWKNSAKLSVGGSGTGTLTVSNGGVVGNTIGAIGAQAGSSGIATVTGAGSTWTNSSDLFVGALGTGTLNILNGGAVSNAMGYVGKSSGSKGAVTVDGVGSKWTNSGSLLVVGNSGTGTLTISNGGTVDSVLSYVGNYSLGTATVDGAGSTWNSSSALYVGVSGGGTGTLTILNGGTVKNTVGQVGYSGGSTGTVTVDGAGSSWLNSSSLLVGNWGTGTLTISGGGTVTSAGGTIGGTATGTGTATVDGANSAWVNSGDLYVGSLGTGALKVLNSGAVSNAWGYIGYNPGSTGTATVDGIGSIWTSAGLDVGVDGTGTLTISNGGAVSVGGTVTIASHAGSIGTLNIGGAAGAAALAPGILNASAVQFGAGTGAINFNHTSTNYTFASAISGAGTVNQIAGMTNLTADSSGFTGATNVTGGRLAVNGSLANSLVTISGGILGGNGTVGGIVAQSGGIIAPGNSIGTLNVAGNIDQAAGSIYQVELTSTGQSDLFQATGTATIAAGAVLDVIKTDAAPYVLGTHYTVLQADAGVTGTYTLSGAGPFIGLLANYDATHVYLDVVQAKSFASVGLTPNQIATGGGAESLGSGNPLHDAIMALPTEAAAQGAFDQLSGEIHASAKGMLLEDSRFLRDAATKRIAAAFGDVGAAPLPVMAYGEGGPEMVTADTGRFAVWGQAFGSWGNTDSDGNAATFGRSTGGLLAGADGLVGDWRVGLIGGYSHSSFDADDRNSSGDADSYHVGLYGGTNWDAIAFRTGAAYSWNSLSTKRAIAFNGFTDALSADYDAGTAQVFGELAYKVDAGRFKFEPFANLAYVSVHTDGFTEQGGGAALTSASSTTNATFTTLGLRASTDLELGGIKTTARGTLGWRHAVGDVTPTSTFAFAGGDAFTIAGVPIATDSAVIEAGFDLQMSANATLGLFYAGQFGAHSADNGAKANLNVKF